MSPPNSPTTQSRGKFAPILLSFLAVGLGFYITQLAIIARQPCQNPSIHNLSEQKDVAARYDETADNFDSEVGTSEALMGINRIRKRLSRACKGHVLEVSCGTGRNLGYYDLSPSSSIDSITFLDLSAQMVEACKRKWASLYPSSSTTPETFKPGLAIRFSTTSAVGPMPPAPSSSNPSNPTLNSNGKYTTILQTMGLCSTPTPHQLLLNLSAHLDHSNPDSRILLLEHGLQQLGPGGRVEALAALSEEEQLELCDALVDDPRLRDLLEAIDDYLYLEDEDEPPLNLGLDRELN